MKWTGKNFLSESELESHRVVVANFAHERGAACVVGILTAMKRIGLSH